MVTPRARVPDRGDIIWVQFSPQSGHEQAGRRPALVVSPAAYNRKTSLLLACPITSKVKGYPFEVAVQAGKGLEGVVLADQVKSLDWRARKVMIDGSVPRSIVEEVAGKISALLG